jgi:predicted Fe-S protein YdhL (DUF1289 family)
MTNMQQEVTSPCIGICAMDDLTGLCQGCFRTLDEIKAWWDMPQSDQKALLTTLEQRQADTINFD